MSKNTITQGRRSLSSSLATLLMLGLIDREPPAPTRARPTLLTPAPPRTSHARKPNAPAFQGEQEKARRGASGGARARARLSCRTA